VTADGDVVVPIDPEAFDFWLKAAFSEPITSGAGPWTHEFRSDNWTLPWLAIETAMPEAPRFAMYSGCVLDQARRGCHRDARGDPALLEGVQTVREKLTCRDSERISQPPAPFHPTPRG
jgi:hypothetical protein